MLQDVDGVQFFALAELPAFDFDIIQKESLQIRGETPSLIFLHIVWDVQGLLGETVMEGLLSCGFSSIMNEDEYGRLVTDSSDGFLVFIEYVRCVYDVEFQAYDESEGLGNLEHLYPLIEAKLLYPSLYL